MNELCTVESKFFTNVSGEYTINNQKLTDYETEIYKGKQELAQTFRLFVLL